MKGIDKSVCTDYFFAVSKGNSGLNYIIIRIVLNGGLVKNGN